MTVAEAARAAYDAGLCVLPPREDGSKKPQPVNGTWGQFKDHRPTPDLLRRWYPGKSGLGIISGPVSGDVECFDVDDRATYDAFLELAKACGLVRVIERIEEGYCDDTPGGGVRWLWRCPGVPRQSNEDLARRPRRPEEQRHPDDRVKVLIELPDFAIVAPSNGTVHPTGQPYTHRSGDFSTIATITVEERTAICDLARSFDQMPDRERLPVETITDADDLIRDAGRGTEHIRLDDLRPGDRYNADASWADVLVGWTLVYTKGATAYWRRPGKSVGISATTNHNGSDLLYVFSTSTPLDANRGYNKFSAYALLQHGGDFHAAARALAERADLRVEEPEVEPPQAEVEPEAPTGGPATAPLYTFACAVPADHFLAQWISYASERTDASHEYHEAAGLALLAAATPTVRARLAPYPNGLPTNLYFLLLGDSTISRKTTSKDFAKDVQARALPGSLSADQFSPEGFVEQLAERPSSSTTLYVDEFGELLDKLHHAKHMAGLRGLLMTVYGGDDYTYARHSKRKEGKGEEKFEDEDRIIEPHLTILGATTPAAFNVLVEADVICGLLPRFAVIVPTTKPARKAFYEVGATTEAQRNALVRWLHRLYEWSTARERRVVTFEAGVLPHLDAFAAHLERISGDQTDTAKAMLQRLPAMAVKLALLIAAGDPATVTGPHLRITMADATSAVHIATRWQAHAIRFADRIGETEFERRLDRCVRLVRTKRKVARSVIARHAHTEKKLLDAIRDTLADRGVIQVQHEKAASGPATEIWVARTEGRSSG